MTTAANQLLLALLQLGSADRAELAAQLLESLELDGDDGTEAELDDEIAKRIDEVKSGRVESVSWAEARSQILADDADGGG